MEDDIIEGLHDFYLLRLGTVIMFCNQPMKLTGIMKIKDRKRLDYELTNIFTNEKISRIVPDMVNYKHYWKHHSYHTKKFSLMVDAPRLIKTVYNILRVIPSGKQLPTQIECLNCMTNERKRFTIDKIIATRIESLLKSNPSLKLKITEICWKTYSTLEFDQSIYSK